MSTLVRLEPTADAIGLQWNDSTTFSFHPLWLRDNCPCAQCRHPQTWERTLDTFAIDLAIRPIKAEIDNDQLVVRWSDDHRSVYETGWLWDHRPGAAADPQVPRQVAWNADLQNRLPSIEFAEVMGGSAGLRSFAQSVWINGVTFVRNTPTTQDALLALARKMGHLRETNFGVDWHVVAKPDPNNVAYTAIELQLHTDLPNREAPPGMQFLHCLVADAPGGDSTLADGLWVAEQIRRDDPEAFALLSSVPIGYRFHDDKHDLRFSAPVISLGSDGAIREVRFHNALREPLDVATDLIGPMYRALALFDRHCRSAQARLSVHLEPGDVMVFHNRRVLHGRGAFDPAGGRRELHGVYVDVDEWLSTLRMLARSSHQSQN